MKNRIVLYFVAVLIVGGVVWGVLHIIQNQDAAIAQFKRDAKVAAQGTVIAHKATEAARSEVARVDTLYLPGRVRWRSALASAIANEKTNPEVASIARRADSVIVGDTVALLARDSLIAKQGAELDSTKRELRVWKNRPGPGRFQLYGEGLYDVIQLAPVARVGLDAHVLGPLMLSSAVECLASPNLPARDACRVTAGLRFNF